MRGQKIRFNKKKCFKILLEIDQIYGDGRGFQNLACFRSRALIKKLGDDSAIFIEYFGFWNVAIANVCRWIENIFVKNYFFL